MLMHVYLVTQYGDRYHDGMAPPWGPGTHNTSGGSCQTKSAFNEGQLRTLPG